MTRPPLYGLVLAGGRSQRMGRDKGALIYPPLASGVAGQDQRGRCFELLGSVCERTYVSCRQKSVAGASDEIVDTVAGEGPGVGILSAAEFVADRSGNEVGPASWFVLACDFPFADADAVAKLARHRLADQPKSRAATGYVQSDGRIEPLFAIWEPLAIDELRQGFMRGDLSARRALERAGGRAGLVLLKSPNLKTLVNVNSVDEARIHGLFSQ